ncbi:MAG: SDR family oxidoreductase [Phycisphaerales bacterium]|nr:SDR family oxidoreductase [Phycisphaerales bacterium]
MDPAASSRISLVTGATAGIGLAIAKELARVGHRVIINARRAEKLREVASELNELALARFPKSATARVVPVAGDASEHATIEACFDVATRAFGTGHGAGDTPVGIDAVIVNAGRGLAGSVVTSDESQWEEMVRTNLIGAARLMRTAALRMVASADEDAKVGRSWRQHPRDIVVIGSVVGRHVSPFSSMYGGTKFGVHGMTEGVRRELAPKGIRVTLIEPGFVVSEFQGVAGYKDEWFQGVVEKIGPVLQPEDVARSVGFVLAQPSHVHVSDILIRPTRQDYP